MLLEADTVDGVESNNILLNQFEILCGDFKYDLSPHKKLELFQHAVVTSTI